MKIKEESWPGFEPSTFRSQLRFLSTRPGLLERKYTRSINSGAHFSIGRLSDSFDIDQLTRGYLVVFNFSTRQILLKSTNARNIIDFTALIQQTAQF